MAEALVFVILEQLYSKEMKLVLDGDKEFQKLTEKIEEIQALIQDAEKREVKEKLGVGAVEGKEATEKSTDATSKEVKKSVGDWLDELKETLYYIDDNLDEWITSVRKSQTMGVENASKPTRKVCSHIPCYRLRFGQVVLSRPEISLKIKNLKSKLDGIFNNSLDFRLASGKVELKLPNADHVSKVNVRDDKMQILLSSLLNENSEGPDISIISIVGGQGTGKSTLARLAFDHNKVNTYFDEKLWVCVSGPFDEIRIAKKIFESLVGEVSNLDQFQTMLQEIRKFLIEKKFLLVLDDVSTKDPNDWKQLKAVLKYGSRGSRILVTTHETSIAELIGTTATKIIKLGLLSNKESRSLFSQIAFSKETSSEECKKLEEIDWKFIGKCKGFPLAIKTLGSLLHSESDIKKWENALGSEMWQPENVERRTFLPSLLREIIKPLLVSYYNLPFLLRQCFLYCAFFPKDYVIKKDTLIKLWMAQSYLRKEEEENLESIGEQYLKILAACFSFEDFRVDKFDNSMKNFKMNDVVYDLAQFMAKDEFCTIRVDDLDLKKHKHKVNSSYKKARHLMVMLPTWSSLRSCFNSEISSLRSLVVKCEKSTTGTTLSFNSIFEQLTSLRTLDLSECSVDEVPRGIEKLIHLRYLNLSQNKNLKELPETLCKLFNLQSLDVSYCNLGKLPHGIDRLVNLRHLRNHGTPLSCMPSGIEKLTFLRQLTKFVASKVDPDQKACRLQSLRNFNLLGGFTIISGLGNVSSDEIKRVSLESKKNLSGLCLSFDGSTILNDEKTFEGLKLPPNLEELVIQHYIGTTLDIGRSKLEGEHPSLHKLRVLKLSSCSGLECLPSLGKLSSLELLVLWNLKNVKKVGNEFLGIESKDSENPVDVDSENSVDVFSKLSTLIIEGMDQWEEWKNEANGKIMPSLCHLELIKCQKLPALPDFILQKKKLKLKIDSCDILERYYSKLEGNHRSKVTHFPDFRYK